jgi:hypothetical protein
LLGGLLYSTLCLTTIVVAVAVGVAEVAAQAWVVIVLAGGS